MKSRMLKNVKTGFTSWRELPLLMVILVSVVALSQLNKNFLSFGNVHSMLLGASFEAIMAIGMTLLLIIGGFDLSIGSVAGMSGVVAGIAIDAQLPILIAILVGLLSGAFIGFLNGVLVAKVGINSMITTLAMQMIVRGLIYVFTRGVGKPSFPQSFNQIGRYLVFGKIQLPIIISIVLVIIFAILFAKSPWFRQFYFIGGNEEAARYSGIRVTALKIFAYTFIGFLSAVAGLLLAARMGGAIPTQGQNMEMNVIAACVIGGCSIKGGEGTMLGSYLGVLVMSLVVNAFNILGVDVYYQRTILGLILLLAVFVDIVRKRKKV